MVPSAALAGFVAPITSRSPLMASSRSRAITTMGPSVMNFTRPAKNPLLAVDGVETPRLRFAQAGHAEPPES